MDKDTQINKVLVWVSAVLGASLITGGITTRCDWGTWAQGGNMMAMVTGLIVLAISVVFVAVI